MVHSQKALNPLAWTADAIETFDAVCSVNPYGPLQNAAELVAGCYLFEYRHGKQAALVALQRDAFSHGVRVHVQALATVNKDHPIQTRQIMAAIEGAAFNLGADVLTMATQHPAIAKGAPRWGGHIAGAVIAKYLGSM